MQAHVSRTMDSRSDCNERERRGGKSSHLQKGKKDRKEEKEMEASEWLHCSLQADNDAHSRSHSRQSLRRQEQGSERGRESCTC